MKATKQDKLDALQIVLDALDDAQNDIDDGRPFDLLCTAVLAVMLAKRAVEAEPETVNTLAAIES